MSVTQLVEKVLTRKNDFCCICFETLDEKAISMEDNVILNINNVESSMLLSDVLSTVLNDEILNYVSEFTSLCMQCVQMSVSSYSFLKKAKENTELLTKVIEGLSGCLENVDNLNMKALYVTLSTEDFSTKQYCDLNKNIHSVPAAFKRLNSILNANEVKPKIEDEDVNKHSNKKKRSSSLVSQIPTEEMLYDPSDSNTMKCKECLKVYPSVWNLRSHFIRVHAPKVYKCPECPRKYGSLGYLETHRAESHCTVVCSECGKIFHNRHTLKMHELGHHMRLVCQKCGRIYKNKNTYNKHIEFNVCGQKSRASPSNAKFECDYCKKKYTQKVSLRVHIQFEHGNYKSLECKWCQKKFWCKSRLNAHIVKHTQEKKFHCTTCDRYFVTKESLLYHTRIHTGEKPYECSQCDARFLSASRRAEHVKRHHAGGSFQCDICQSKFTSQNYLQRHKRVHFLPERDEDFVSNKLKSITKLADDVDGKQFVIQSNQIPNFSSVYNYDEMYLEVGNADYNIKIEP